MIILIAPILKDCMGSCMGKKEIREILKISRIFDEFCGVEGFRTLVQLCDKLCLLHAYFPIAFREASGWKPTLTTSLGILFHSCIIPLQKLARLYRCLWY